MPVEIARLRHWQKRRQRRDVDTDPLRRQVSDFGLRQFGQNRRKIEPDVEGHVIATGQTHRASVLGFHDQRDFGAGRWRVGAARHERHALLLQTEGAQKSDAMVTVALQRHRIPGSDKPQRLRCGPAGRCNTGWHHRDESEQHSPKCAQPGQASQGPDRHDTRSFPTSRTRKTDRIILPKRAGRIALNRSAPASGHPQENA